MHHSLTEAPRVLEAPVVKLTKRKMEVLRLIVNGKSSPQIAVILGISIHTVEAHRAKLMKEIGVHKTADLVVHAIRNSLVSVSFIEAPDTQDKSAPSTTQSSSMPGIRTQNEFSSSEIRLKQEGLFVVENESKAEIERNGRTPVRGYNNRPLIRTLRQISRDKGVSPEVRVRCCELLLLIDPNITFNSFSKCSLGDSMNEEPAVAPE